MSALRLIIFFSLCLSGFLVHAAKDCVFDWQSFTSFGDPWEHLLDFSEQHIETLTEGEQTFHYIAGPVKAKAEIGDSYEVLHSLEKIDGESKTIFLNIVKACKFLNDIYPRYLLPIAGKHNDFRPQGNMCPIKQRTHHIFPARSYNELLAPSELSNGKYRLLIDFMKKDETSIGGIAGDFTVLRN